MKKIKKAFRLLMEAKAENLGTKKEFVNPEIEKVIEELSSILISLTIFDILDEEK